MTLSAQDIGVTIGARRILDRITLTLPPGLTAICGPNGAGKSTLLKVLTGLLVPDQGRVTLDGANISELDKRQRARAIGYLAQHGSVAWDLKVEHLVSLARLPWRAGEEADAAAIERALTLTAMQPLRARPFASLSGGERARALLARVLAGEPEWILADEPVAALDLESQHAILSLLQQRSVERSGAVVVLHDLALARRYADHVVVLANGALVKAGPPGEVLSEHLIADVWRVETAWVGTRDAEALAYLSRLG